MSARPQRFATFAIILSVIAAIAAVIWFGRSKEVAASSSRLGDYDADGKADLVLFRPFEAKWFIVSFGSYSRSGAINAVISRFKTGTMTQFGAAGDLPVPGDYDGDGKNDLAVYRPSSATWLVLQSSTGSVVSCQIGRSDDIPVPADYDGDHKTDIAVYRPSSGVWLILESARRAAPPRMFTLGSGTDIPVPADYDGDGIADFAVFRPGLGTWQIVGSRPGSTLLTTQWGINGDVPVPGDYDGDGRTDLAIFRPATLRWYLKVAPSEVPWGLSGDIPVPGDYDGDGKTDIAIFRPNGGSWYVLKSNTNFTRSTIVQWGEHGDIPILGRR